MGLEQLICYVLTFSILAAFQGPDTPSARSPASAGGDCYTEIKSFLGKRPALSRAWSKFKKVTSGNKIDQERLNLLREEYSTAMERENIHIRNISPTSEGILAYIEALNKTLGGDHIPELRKMNFFRRHKVSKIVDALNSERKILMSDIEDLIGDLYLAAYGPSMRANEVLFEDHIEKKVLARVIQEDMASRGLAHIFTKYKVLGRKKTWAQKFVRSSIGRALGTSFMNLPVLYGFPPIYLPGLKPIKIPNSMVDDLIMNGLNSDNLVKLEQEIGRQLGDKLTFNLQNRARYRLFRRYYMASISIYITYMTVVEFYETNNSLTEEAKLLDEMTGEMTSTIENALELEAKGYEIFENNSESEKTHKDNRWCQAILQCLEAESEDIGEKVQKDSESYFACKEFMDPNNLCPGL